MTPSARQLDYLRFIAAFVKRRGYAPSFEEIGGHFLVSTPSVNNMIKTLEARGFLSRVPGAARSLRITIPLDAPQEPAAAKGKQRVVSPPPGDPVVAGLLRFATLAAAQLPHALRAHPQEALFSAFDAVCTALERQLTALRVKEPERKAAIAAFVTAANAANKAHRRPVRVRSRVWVKLRDADG
ncbi:MAG: hypothetical protein HY904_24435 [Deltaproteobacteria bacterium]|nr:hypothetical protein [Deltaproteobacteria bacterium]